MSWASSDCLRVNEFDAQCKGVRHSLMDQSDEERVQRLHRTADTQAVYTRQELLALPLKQRE